MTIMMMMRMDIGHLDVVTKSCEKRFSAHWSNLRSTWEDRKYCLHHKKKIYFQALANSCRPEFHRRSRRASLTARKPVGGGERWEGNWEKKLISRFFLEICPGGKTELWKKIDANVLNAIRKKTAKFYFKIFWRSTNTIDIKIFSWEETEEFYKYKYFLSIMKV